jgi:hypothetical protein
VKIIMFVILLALNAADVRSHSTAGGADAARAAALLSSIEKRLPEAATQIRWLRGTIRTGTTLPPEVLSSLAAVEEALATAGDDSNVRALVLEDLSLKAAYCRRHPQGMGALIELSARTWAAEGSPPPEVSQWNVMYLSAPLAERRDTGEPFPNFSSPTTKRLPPGRYVLWAQHPADSQRRGPRKTVTVGDPNAKIDERVVADLLVPGSWR